MDSSNSNTEDTLVELSTNKVSPEDSVRIGEKVQPALSRDASMSAYELEIAVGKILKYIVVSEEKRETQVSRDEALKHSAKQVLLAVFVGMAYFGLTEGWRALDAFWFSFVTLTTSKFWPAFFFN